MPKQTEAERLSQYLSAVAVAAIDNNYSDPDFEQRKVEFLLESGGEDLTTLQTVGSRDGKIDAYRIQQDDGDGHMVVEIWQLSGPDENAMRAGVVSSPPANKLKNDLLGLAATLRYGQKSLSEDGVEAVRAVRDKLARASRAKRDVQLKLTVLTLYAVTESARSRLEKLASEELEKLSHASSSVRVDFSLRALEDFTAMSAGDGQIRPSLGELTLDLAAPGAIASFADATLVFARPASLVAFYRRHRAALLHANARFSLGAKRTTANPEIAKSAEDEGKAKRFHELNNGLVVTCTDLAEVLKEKKVVAVRLHNPQVVNGGQTLHTLTEVEKKVASGEPCFVSDVVLPLKIVKLSRAKDGSPEDLERAEAIAVASNRQAPLSSRALASYSPVNKRLQQSFARLIPPWFFERTDGEWRAFRDKNLAASYRASITGHREASAFVLTRAGEKGSTPRKLVNAELLEALLSAYGCFDEAKPKRVFEEEVFPEVLNVMLTDAGWRQFVAADEPAGSLERFTDKFDWENATHPPVHLYLLVWLLFSSVGWLTLSEARARAWVLEVHNARKWSKKKFEKYEQWLAWSKELPKYAGFEWAEHVANAMQKPLVFLQLRLLAERYGPLDEDVCRGILTLPQFSRLASGEPAKKVLSQDDCRAAKIGDAAQPVYTLFQLCRQACASLFADHRDEIRGMGTKQQTLLGTTWVSRLGRHLDALTGDLGAHQGQFLIGTELSKSDLSLADALPPLTTTGARKGRKAASKRAARVVGVKKGGATAKKASAARRRSGSAARSSR